MSTVLNLRRNRCRSWIEIRRPFCKYRVEARIVPVDILEEVRRAVLVDHHRAVEQVDPERPFQIHAPVVRAALHGGLDRLAIPLALAAEDEFRQRRRVGYADASVAEIAPAFCEQSLGRCVVHVDVERIGKDELEQPERVVVPGTLPDAAVVKLVVVPGEVGRILL